MTTPTDIKYIVIDPEIYGGRPTIAGHRIAVIDVAVWLRQGMTPDEIARQFHLTLAEVHAALAYYHDHKAELDERMLAEHAAQDTSPLMERLHAEGRT